jgi:hypothetical protein
MRITVRFNEAEEKELNHLKETFHIENDSEAIKVGIEWVNRYLKNVSEMFFPPSYNVILQRRLKTVKQERKVYD